MLLILSILYLFVFKVIGGVVADFEEFKQSWKDNEKKAKSWKVVSALLTVACLCIVVNGYFDGKVKGGFDQDFVSFTAYKTVEIAQQYKEAEKTKDQILEKLADDLKINHQIIESPKPTAGCVASDGSDDCNKLIKENGLSMEEIEKQLQAEPAEPKGKVLLSNFDEPKKQTKKEKKQTLKSEADYEAMMKNLAG